MLLIVQQTLDFLLGKNDIWMTGLPADWLSISPKRPLLGKILPLRFPFISQADVSRGSTSGESNLP